MHHHLKQQVCQGSQTLLETPKRIFNYLFDIFVQDDFQPHQISNFDEIGVTTEQSPSKVISKKGTKQFDQIF